jgi:glutaredoxin
VVLVDSILFGTNRRIWLLFLVAIAGALPQAGLVAAEQATREATRCVRIEVFTRSDCPHSAEAMKFLRNLEQTRDGLKLVSYDILQDRQALARVRELSRKHNVGAPGVPTILVAGQLHVGWDKAETTGRTVEESLVIELFTRDGCDHCRRAREYVGRIVPRYAAFKVRVYEVITDIAARQRLDRLARQHNIQAPGVPAFHLCGRMIIGFLGDDITGPQIEGLLNAATVPCEEQRRPAAAAPARSAVGLLRNASPPTPLLAASSWLVQSGPSRGGAAPSSPLPEDETPLTPLPPDGAPLTPLPSEEASRTPLPDLGGDRVNPGDTSPLEQASPVPESINVPVFGRLRVRELGLPLFTFLIGLVDGFNPCAMWVLLFLLSLLVNLKDRRKILAIAGTFVLISGLAYFAFMAAWLNVFLLIGYARPAQIVLALLAIVIGAVNVKDFFALHRGISFSIPESAKPGIYERVRKIVTAEYLTAALAGAVVLAVLVNTVELLCTAGLPALYAQILTLHELPQWQNYAYLALYNVAYMLDDAVMVAIVVITLSRTKLQERAGRWLKLLSGLVILMLGLVMLFRPGWLV